MVAAFKETNYPAADVAAQKLVKVFDLDEGFMDPRVFNPKALAPIAIGLGTMATSENGNKVKHPEGDDGSFRHKLTAEELFD